MKKRKGRNRRRRLALYPRSSLILLLTILYCGIYVAHVFNEQFTGIDVPHHTLLWQEFLDAATAFIQIFCLFFGLTLFRLLWVVTWPLLMLFSGLGDYMVSTFHSQISKDSVAVVLESTGREAENFFSNGLALSLAGAVLMGVFGIMLLKRERKERRNVRVAAVALLMALVIIGVNGGSMATRFAPYNFLTAASSYALERYAFFSTPRKNISAYSSTYRTTSDKPMVLVMVIGESARADHFSINGYERETSPLMQKRKNLVNFKDTSSCGVWTRVAVPCILTRATESDKSAIYTETSLISLFKSLGFYTAWLGAQNAIDYPLADIVHEADYYTLLEGKQILDNTMKDEELLPLMDKVLNENNGPILIILHTFGSHWQYSARYPREFEKFTPDCDKTLSRHYNVGEQLAEIRNCTQGKNHDALVNSYDNSILYTDYILDQVMQKLEGKNALVVYTSDHGESLGESGRFLHGYEAAPENHMVPMFWWGSDSFISGHDDGWKALLAKSANSSSHDVIFHSLLDCAGISSVLIDPALSLCHSGEPPAPAPQPPESAPESRPEATVPATVKTLPKPSPKEPEDTGEGIPPDEEDSFAEPHTHGTPRTHSHADEPLEDRPAPD